MTDEESFEALFAQFERQHADEPKRPPRVGDLVRGTVVSIGPEVVHVDVGGKVDAVIERQDVSGADGESTLQPGDAVELAVSAIDPDTGTLLLGSQHAQRLHGSADLEEAFRQYRPVEGHVSGVTKGGLEVQVAGVRAFCPASQVSLQFVEDLSSYVGQRLAFRITKFTGGRHPDLVVSRRELLEEERKARAAELRAAIEPGAVLPGTVTSLQDYGAFVDLGGIEGMIHISELAFERVRHPADLLQVGQQVECAVLRVERTDNPKRPEKIALSLRALAKDPWSDVGQRFPVGSVVVGRVTRIQPFGAFVELAPGVEGMIHISELGAGRRVGHPGEVVQVGSEVTPTVLQVDPQQRRIALSLDPSRQGGDAAVPSPADYAGPAPGMGTLGDLLRESLAKGADDGKGRGRGGRG